MKCTLFKQESAPLAMFMIAEMVDDAKRHLSPHSAQAPVSTRGVRANLYPFFTIPKEENTERS